MLSSLSAFAWELPSLPADPAISCGRLPNGISYYLVTDKSYKGMADFALVCKAGTSCEDSLSSGWIGEMVKTALSSPSRLGGRGVRTFLAGNGMYNTGTGLAEIGERSVVYRFPGLALSRSQSAVDSTLLVMLGIAEDNEKYNRPYFKKWCPTSSYAIIVSGDIDNSAMLDRLQLLSLIIPRRDSDAELPPYEWQHRAEPKCSVSIDSTSLLSAIKVTYSSPRIPERYMHTILPAVSERLGNILSEVVGNRLRKELRLRSIPVASADCRYVSSSDTSGDEKYEIAIKTGANHILSALTAVSQVLSEIASEGIPIEEYSVTNSGCLMSLYKNACNQSEKSGKYVDECISSFLYGTSSATKADKFHYFASHCTEDESMLSHFNRFASAMFGENSNLSILCTGVPDGLTSDDVIELYANAWNHLPTDKAVYHSNLSDTLRLVATDAPVKVEKMKKDPVSGGSMWSFSNGMKVIYKKMPTGGLLHYSMLVRGGASILSDFKEGEEAHFTDILNHSEVAGIAAEDFHNILFAKGISMTGEVSLADTKIYGTAPRSSLNLLMKSMVALANDIGMSEETFDYYALCRNWEKSTLLQRSKELFAEQFTRMNEGVLMIVGDMDEAVLRRVLIRYMGQFSTNGKKGTRINIPYRPVSGWMMRTDEGEVESVDIELSAPLQFSAENYFASKVAEEAVHDAMAYALSDASVSLTTVSDMAIYPRERFCLKVSANEISDASLPYGTLHVEPMEMLLRMRSVLSDLSSSAIPAENLDAYKENLKNEIDSRQSDPWYWIEMMSVRYSCGKDINSKYGDRINSVTAEKVRAIIASLNENGKTESITNRK